MPPSQGQVLFEGRDIAGLPPYAFARIGIARKFQITNVFKQLSAHENVRVAVQMQPRGFRFFVRAAPTLG